MLRFVAALVFVLALADTAAAAALRRVALVVGVSAYQNVPRLPNATNDSNAMAEMFKKAGFDVVSTQADLSNIELKRAIRSFEDAVVDADIAVVYYAGHGIEVRNTNYLVPADARLATERDVEDEAIALDRIVTAIEPAKRLRLIILDACRDNPFASRMKPRVATRGVPASAGLSPVQPVSSDTLIAYAAKGQAVADDGVDGHSPFTTALINNLTSPGLDIRLAFGRVRDEVMKATGGRQEPFVYGSLGGTTVALVPAPVVAVAVDRTDIDAQKADYEIVERVGKTEAWKLFLTNYKSGLYVDLARVQLAKLSEGNATVDVPRGTGSNGETRQAPPRVETLDIPASPKPTAAEQRAWDKLKASSDRAGLRKFLEQYATSPLAAPAKDRLEALDRLAREREEAARAEREAAAQHQEEVRRAKAADLERQRLEREATRQREAEERAKVAEVERQKAEAAAAAKQRDAEERVKAAEALALQRDAEERARIAEVAARKKDDDERALAARQERDRVERETADRRRQDDERLKGDAVADAERLRIAREAAARLEAETQARSAEIERAKASSESAEVQQRLDVERAKSAEAERVRALDVAARERVNAAEAASAAEARRVERTAAAKRREAAEAARQEAEAAADVGRRKAAETSRKAAERQAERQAAAAERQRRDALLVRATKQVRVAAPAPAAARSNVEAGVRPSRSGGSGATMVGIGF